MDHPAPLLALPLLPDLLERLLDIVLIADVAPEKGGVALLLSDLLALVLVQVEEGERGGRRAGVEELDDGETETGGGAGDDPDFVTRVHGVPCNATPVV